MTLIRLSDIREQDVRPESGMSNVPWTYDYGFQKVNEPLDDQDDILDEIYFFKSNTESEAILDGLSPDADGTFTTNVLIKREGKPITAVATRELLIEKANELLRAASIRITFQVQREFVQERSVEYHYEFNRNAKPTRGLDIDGIAHPLTQILDLRGPSVIGKMEWVNNASKV